MDSYRSLPVWRRAHRLCVETLRTADVPCSPRAIPVFHQLRRAALLAETNIVKGHVLRNSRYYRRHLAMALGSAVEVECLLNITAELECISGHTLTKLRNDVNETIRLLFEMFESLGSER